MSTTTNMQLEVPVVAQTLGPEWAIEINYDMQTIDTHDHSNGKGVRVTPSGININQDFIFSSYNATQLRSTRYTSQSSTFSLSSDNNSISVFNGNLVFRDSSGNNIQITADGGINIASVGTIGGDYGQPGVPAAAVYSDTTKTFSWTQDSGIGAKMASSDLKISYPSFGAQAITIGAPALATAYNITLPSAQAVDNGSLMIHNTDGQAFFTTTLESNFTFTGNNEFTGVQTLSSLTASQALELNSSKEIISTAITGTGDFVKSDSPTIDAPTVTGTSTIATANITTGTVTTLGSTTATITTANITTDNVTTLNATTAGITTAVVTNSTFTNAPTLNSTTASQILAVDGSKVLTSIAATGTGSVVKATSPSITTPAFVGTPTGTITSASFSPTLNWVHTSGATVTLTVTSSTNYYERVGNFVTAVGSITSSYGIPSGGDGFYQLQATIPVSTTTLPFTFGAIGVVVNSSTTTIGFWNIPSGPGNITTVYRYSYFVN